MMALKAPVHEIYIGLIADTHIPERWEQLPAAVFELFAEVDFILYAGDVGKLWVLDHLGAIAPVIAVHGNDETDEATAALPYQQVLSVKGRRILLTHAHYPNRDEEMESRKEDRWVPKLARWAAIPVREGRLMRMAHTRWYRPIVVLAG
jgi:predicted phosphodiesterase